MELVQPERPADPNVNAPTLSLSPVPPQVPVPPVSKKSFLKPILIVVILLLLALGSATVLAWKTSYLDQYLPASVKELFGKDFVDSDGDNEGVGKPVYEEPKQGPKEIVQACVGLFPPICPETKALSALIKRATDAQGVGFYYAPILRAQDVDDAATTTLIYRLGDTALVGSTSFETYRLYFYLKIESGEWKIDDVYCPDKPETGIVAIWTEDLMVGIPPCE